MGMHARTRVVRIGLRHERRVHPLLERDLLHDQPEGHDVVCGGECVGVPQVDLLLPWCALVVAELHRDAEALEDRDRGSPEVVRHRVWSVVEVTPRIDRYGSFADLRPPLEEEELDLRVGVEGEAELRRSAQRTFEDPARVRVGRAAVRQEDVAEHSRSTGRLGPPREDLEGRRIRFGQHVRLVHPGKTLDRRTVEPEPLCERPLEFGGRDRDRLQETEDVGEPQPDEPDVSFLERPKHKLLLLIHDHSSPQVSGLIATQNAH